MNPSAQEVRILLADDHPIFAMVLKVYSKAEVGLKVVAEASNGAEAVKLVKLHKPDLLLLDLSMPQQTGIEAIRELGSLGASVRIILLTARWKRARSSKPCNWARAASCSRFSNTDFDPGRARGDGRRVLGGPRAGHKPGAVICAR